MSALHAKRAHHFDPHAPVLIEEWEQAVQTATVLSAHLPWSSVAYVMREYHGWDYAAGSWRAFMHTQGLTRSARGQRGQAIRHGRSNLAHLRYGHSPGPAA